MDKTTCHRALPGLLLLVLPCTLALACGGRQSPPTSAHAERVRVATVQVKGNRSFDSKDLVSGLALTRQRKNGAPFDPYLVGQDAERLRGFYLRRGYFRVEVTPVVEQKNNRVAVLYNIEEGPVARLARVEMTGLPRDPNVDAEDIRELIPLDDGERFDYEPYDEARPMLTEPLQRAGYAYARVETKVAADVIRDEAIIHLEFTPGPLCQFGEVRLHGVTGELGEAALARVGAAEGERFSSALLTETQDELYSMGRFAAVRIEPDRSTGSAIVPVDIYVTEQVPNELRLGGGFGINPTAYEVRTRAMYTIAGWPRPLVTSHFELRPAYVFLRDTDEREPRIEAITSLERLDLVVPKLIGELELSYNYLAVEAYTSYGPRVRLGLRYPIYKRIVQASAGWQLRLLDFSRIHPAIDPMTRLDLGFKDNYLLGFYEQNIYVDLRNDPVDPHRGVYGELRVEEGGIAAGSEFTYVKLTPELRAYVPLGRRIVLATKGRVGTILGDLPVTQRYYAGGASSQRGFPERRLAPNVVGIVDGREQRTVVGGGAMVETSAELRVPIGEAWKLQFGGVVFVDGADVSRTLEDVAVGYMHWAVGLGLRIATPVGPARIDVGYRLNRKGPDEPNPGEDFAYHLSLGEAF